MDGWICSRVKDPSPTMTRYTLPLIHGLSIDLTRSDRYIVCALLLLSLIVAANSNSLYRKSYFDIHITAGNNWTVSHHIHRHCYCGHRRPCICSNVPCCGSRKAAHIDKPVQLWPKRRRPINGSVQFGKYIEHWRRRICTRDYIDRLSSIHRRYRYIGIGILSAL